MKRYNSDLGRYILAAGLYIASAMCFVGRNLAAAIVAHATGIGGNLGPYPTSPAVSPSSFSEALSHNSGLTWVASLFLILAVGVTLWALCSSPAESQKAEQDQAT